MATPRFSADREELGMLVDRKEFSESGEFSRMSDEELERH